MIDAHVHFIPDDFYRHPRKYFRDPEIRDYLCDVGFARIAELHGGRLPTWEEYWDRVLRQPGRRAVVFGLSDHPEGCRLVNEAVWELSRRHPDKVIPFVFLPLSDPREWQRQLRWAREELGIRGAKIYPSMFRLEMCSPEVLSCLGACADARMVVITDCTFLMEAGSTAGPLSGNWLHALVLSGALDEMPRLRLIAAHLGGGAVFLGELLAFWRHFGRPQAAEDSQPFRQVWFDTSPFFSSRTLEAAVRAVGCDRLVFGSDFPFSFGNEGMTALERTRLTPEERLRILYNNMMDLLSGQAGAE